MPKAWFSKDKIKLIATLKPGAKVHVIGVCGVAMAQMALALAEKGFKVSGSDKEFYEPMGSVLRNSSIKILEGYDEKHITKEIDLAIIGNTCSYENPEVLAVEKLSLPYSMFPKVLFELAIANKHSIVVSGTHGKSTTSALLATVLTKLGCDPSYFVGAAVNELGTGLKIGTGSVSVVEGDEYDSSFFAKVPKFFFYAPNTLIITSLEYDHADIYPDLQAIIKVFEETLKTLKGTDKVLIGLDCANLKRLLPAWKKQFSCKFISYGEDAGSDLKLEKIEQQGFLQRVQFTDAKQILSAETEISFSLPLSGKYNARNALAVLCATRLSSPDSSKGQLDLILQAISSFRGLKRRQEIRFHGAKATLIEDFAHHPTAVRETLLGIRKALPDKRLIAIFEPRSTTSRRKVFQQEYVDGFKSADKILLCEVQAKAIDKGQDLLDVKELTKAISSSGKDAKSLASPQEIFTYVCSDLKAGDALVVMSNGSFGGLPKLLEDYLRGNDG